MANDTPREYLNSVARSILTAASMGAAYGSWSDAFARKEVAEAWADKPSVMRKERGRRVTVADLSAMDRNALYDLGFANWDGSLVLIPLWAFNYIADGETLTSISGDTAVKGSKEIDLDVRGGCIAFGFVHSTTAAEAAS